MLFEAPGPPIVPKMSDAMLLIPSMPCYWAIILGTFLEVQDNVHFEVDSRCRSYGQNLFKGDYIGV